jgi:hypothetical protein
MISFMASRSWARVASAGRFNVEVWIRDVDERVPPVVPNIESIDDALPVHVHGIDHALRPPGCGVQGLRQADASVVQILSSYAGVVERMEGYVLDKLLLCSRNLRFVSGNPPQDLLFGDHLGCFDTSRNFGNHVGNRITPGGDSRQHFLARCRAAGTVNFTRGQVSKRIEMSPVLLSEHPFRGFPRDGRGFSS